MDKRPDAGDATTDPIRQLTDKVEGLQEALLSRDVIGQAKGILMERLHLTSDQAFEQLRTASQRANRKVRDIAAELAETGAWPLDGTGAAPGPDGRGEHRAGDGDSDGRATRPRAPQHA